MQFSFAFPLFLYTPGSEAPKIFLFWISFDGYFPIIWIYLSISCLWNFWPILDSADQLCHQPRNDETAGQTCENDEDTVVTWNYICLKLWIFNWNVSWIETNCLHVGLLWKFNVPQLEFPFCSSEICSLTWISLNDKSFQICASEIFL